MLCAFSLFQFVLARWFLDVTFQVICLAFAAASPQLLKIAHGLVIFGAQNCDLGGFSFLYPEGPFSYCRGILGDCGSSRNDTWRPRVKMRRLWDDLKPLILRVCSAPIVKFVFLGSFPSHFLKRGFLLEDLVSYISPQYPNQARFSCLFGVLGDNFYVFWFHGVGLKMLVFYGCPKRPLR